ncbi:MAG: hypothetical protein ACYTET_01865 [Planctomycetota bacterium]
MVVQKEKDAAQAVLDDYQNQADQLMRKAEQAAGDEKLQLQNQGFDILKKRKDYYIDVQAAENQLNVLGKKIQLQQLTVNNLTQSVSDARNQQSLVSLASEIKSGLNEYKNFFLGQGLEKTSALGFFEDAADEFKKIRAGDADFVAKCRLAESYYYAALVCTGYVNIRKDLSERLKDLVDFTEPAFAESLASKLPVQMQIDSGLQEQTLGYYDQALEAYETAFSRAGRVGADAKCSVLKSQLLATHSKMKFADMIGNVTGNYDLATETEVNVDKLIAQGTELGVCFTQSEAFKVVSRGIDYMPTLPMNMDVLADGLKAKFTAWKGKPLLEQEAEIDQNLIEIDELIAKYGQELSDQLTPLKQEMQAAKERGFEPTDTTTTAPSGLGDPNSF